ncbi:DUF333 domain-containing protein [Ralstonia sp. UBA689]|uniref:DUF333 domain-containing protein n=1 Tax=Ralstonia sp. UBA689 TaxID=1947373 RepID=UPI0025E87421|nr:DUF333 domain-containing protein [Ralstonia sp. UBA689]
MDRAVCLVKDAGRSRRAAVIAACMLAMGLAACSSPMPPWQPPRTTIQPASPASTVPSAPVAHPAQVSPAMPLHNAPLPAATTAEPPRSNVGMANPASTYCLQRGGQLELSTRANGGEVGICVSPGGDECEEWAFLRGSCTW